LRAEFKMGEVTSLHSAVQHQVVLSLLPKPIVLLELLLVILKEPIVLETIVNLRIKLGRLGSELYNNQLI